MTISRSAETRRRAATSVTRATLAALAVAMIAPIVFGACSSHDIDATAFDQSCTQDADCVAVYSGELTCCYGSNCEGYDAAINRSALSAYESAEQANAESCDVPCVSIECTGPAAACVSGKCAVASPK